MTALSGWKGQRLDHRFQIVSIGEEQAVPFPAVEHDIPGLRFPFCLRQSDAKAEQQSTLVVR